MCEKGGERANSPPGGNHAELHPSAGNLAPARGQPGAAPENAKSRGSTITAAAVFLRQKQPGSAYLHEPAQSQSLAVILTSRLLSRRTAFSGIIPMAGFRPVQPPPRLQWRYRSGVAPDSLFSPTAPTAPGALSWLFTFGVRIP